MKTRQGGLHISLSGIGGQFIDDICLLAVYVLRECLRISGRDEIIARVNIFNYGGAVAGAVLVGLLASPIGYGPSFLALAFALLCVLLFRKRFN